MTQDKCTVVNLEKDSLGWHRFDCPVCDANLACDRSLLLASAPSAIEPSIAGTWDYDESAGIDGTRIRAIEDHPYGKRAINGFRDGHWTAYALIEAILQLNFKLSAVSHERKHDAPCSACGFVPYANDERGPASAPVSSTRTLNSIERYSAGFAGLEHDPDGQWVRFSDVASMLSAMALTKNAAQQMPQAARPGGPSFSGSFTSAGAAALCGICGFEGNDPLCERKDCQR